AQNRDVESHLSSCPNCVTRLAEVEASDPLVEIVQGGARRPPVLEDARSELIERLCQLRGEQVESTDRAPTPEDDASVSGKPVLALDFLEPAREPGEIGRIGEYRIEKVLGTGGMGIVFQARQARPWRRVALKMILAGPRAGRERLDRFRGESEIL